jgi:diaminohydroxyphosphoribosylaminopyrimidine deaminase/5-amino-6-(5-phosphoribosylamino)uracil reductase
MVSVKLLNDEYYMSIAIKLAESTQGQTEVNPVVGCVVVNKGKVVGMGAHLSCGKEHAEVYALNMAGDLANGSTLYVTLEPCNHFGKTPPCAEKIIGSKVKRVVISNIDPNPNVSGRGILRLRESGIEVLTGVLSLQAKRLNENFYNFIQYDLPFVTLKSACTLDGKIATDSGDAKWISNSMSRERVHSLRHYNDAIMVGVETIIKDDPELTTRLSISAKNPIRIIADSSLRIPLSSKVLHDKSVDTYILTTTRANRERIEKLDGLCTKVIMCGDGPHVDLNVAMSILAKNGITSVLLEGGSKLNGAMFEAGLVNKVIIIISTKIVGGFQAPSLMYFKGFSKMSEAIQLEDITVEQCEENIIVNGYVPRIRKQGQAEK